MRTTGLLALGLLLSLTNGVFAESLESMSAGADALPSLEQAMKVIRVSAAAAPKPKPAAVPGASSASQPDKPEMYYRTKTTSTVHFFNPVTGARRADYGPHTFSGLQAVYKEGGVTFSLSYTRLPHTDLDDPEHYMDIVDLKETVRTNGADGAVAMWNDYHAFAVDETNALVEKPSTTVWKGIDSGDGTITFTDPTNSWGLGKDAVVTSILKKNPDGSSDQRMKGTKMKQFVGADISESGYEIHSTYAPMDKDDFNSSFPMVIVNFLKEFGALNQKASELNRRLNACQDAGTASCDDLEAQYHAADEARHEYWSGTLQAADVYPLLPD